MRGQAEEEFRDWAAGGRGALRRTAFLLSGDWFLADDLVQDALVRIYQAWPRLRRREHQVEEAGQLVLAHGCSCRVTVSGMPRSARASRKVARPRLACDFTVPALVPSSCAVCSMLRSSQ